MNKDWSRLGIREQRKCNIVVAVAGNPNVGKSTLFNVLTGETAHVANWPGVTVELKVGDIIHRNKKICFVDLPGTYGITASSIDEVIAREYIVGGEADLVLVLVDSTAPERTIYLALQILELTPKVVIALTKIDLAHSMGIHIHVDKLEAKLGVPVIPVSAVHGVGIRELLDAIIDVVEGKRGRSTPLRIDYDGLEPYIAELEPLVRKSKALRNYNPRWASIRLLEGDHRLEELLRKAGEEYIITKVNELREAITKGVGKTPEDVTITIRFEYAEKLMRDVVVRVEHKAPMTTSLIDKVFQHPIIGPITSLSVLIAVFFLAFAINTGFPLNILLSELGFIEAAEVVEEFSFSSLLDSLFSWLSDAARTAMESNAPEWLVSLIADGIIPGVGSVLTFLPLIILISLFIAMLEDSGLAPRMATSFHNFFSSFGLSGKAIFPMIISLGCNVPGVLASRTATEEEERVEIILSTPFIPCQARLVVILAFATAFFKSPLNQALLIAGLYVLGILVFLITSLVARKVLFKRKEAPEFIIEIPPLHKPSAKVVWWITWDYSKHFLKKAGIIIFLLSIVTWLLLTYGPQGLVEDPIKSYGAILGHSLAPIFKALWGLNDESAWKVSFALIHGFIAKEALIEAITLLEGAEGVDEALLGLGISIHQAIAILAYMTLYVPCLATIAVMYQELKNLKLTIIAVVYMLVLATILSTVIYYLLLIIA